MWGDGLIPVPGGREENWSTWASPEIVGLWSRLSAALFWDEAERTMSQVAHPSGRAISVASIVAVILLSKGVLAVAHQESHRKLLQRGKPVFCVCVNVHSYIPCPPCGGPPTHRPCGPPCSSSAAS